MTSRKGQSQENFHLSGHLFARAERDRVNRVAGYLNCMLPDTSIPKLYYWERY